MSYLPGSLPSPPQSRLARLCARYIELASRRAGWILLATVGLIGLALIPVLKLELRTDLAELLPRFEIAPQLFLHYSKNGQGITDLDGEQSGGVRLGHALVISQTYSMSTDVIEDVRFPKFVG